MPGPETKSDRLHCSLDRVHALLRQGDLLALPEATAEMEAELVALSAAGATLPSAVDLTALLRKLERNAQCLKAAMRGIRSARRRIAEVRTATTGLAAYDSAGQRIAGPAAPMTMARRF